MFDKVTNCVDEYSVINKAGIMKNLEAAKASLARYHFMYASLYYLALLELILMCTYFAYNYGKYRR